MEEKIVDVRQGWLCGLRKRKKKVVFVAHDEQHNVKEEKEKVVLIEREHDWCVWVHHIMLK